MTNDNTPDAPIRKCLLWHRWSYRNPHDRRCKDCGLHQQEHIAIGKNLFGVVVHIDEWEEVY